METCPSEMANDASQETCPSDMANDASQLQIILEKLETIPMLQIDVLEKLETFAGAMPLLQIDVSEKMETLSGAMPMLQIDFLEELKKLSAANAMLITRHHELNRLKYRGTENLFKRVTTEAEETNVLRQQVYELKEIFEKSMDKMELFIKSTDKPEVYFSVKREKYKNPSTNIEEYMEASDIASDIADASYQVLLFILAAIDEWLESRKKVFIVLLAVHFLGNNDDCKRPARPDRGKISCITVYLLGNDGAHSYNGNGIRFTKTTIIYVRITDMELADQLGHAEPPSDVLLRQPTDREQATITRDVLLRQPTDREQATSTRDVLLRQPTDRELATITRGVLLRQPTDRELATITRDVFLRQPTDREQTTVTRDVLLRQPTERELATTTRDVILRQPTDREQATITRDVLLRQPTDRELATVTRDVLLRQPTDREQATITRDVLLRQPTDRELATIAMKIGDEYVLLAAFLEIGRAELAHIREDDSRAVLRIYNMLLKWKENKGSHATIEKLADAVEKSGNNADIVYSSLDDAMI